MKKVCYIIVFALSILLGSLAAVKAQQQTEETGDVVLKATPYNKTALFTSSEEVRYRVQLHNNTKQQQNGRVLYQVTTDDGKKVTADSVRISLREGGDKDIIVNIRKRNTGFYRINFIVKLPEYDDTVRRVFGVNPEKVTSQLHKPKDFDAFWKQSKVELAQVPANYRVLERKDLSTQYKKVYSVEMHSYGDLVIRGWLVVPTDGNKFPVHYRVPGYVVSLQPNMDNDDFIAFDLNVRGNGNSKDVINIGTDNYSLINIENKEKYIYRGVYMDCLRGLDFLYSHSNLGIDTSKIFVEGGSQGGSLALITAALDKRVKLLTMQVPLYADIHDNFAISASYDQQVFPFKVFRKYQSQHAGFSWEKFYSTFDYYDPQNFAPMVKCPVLMGIGLLDQFCPPRCSMALYNHISSTNKEFVCVPNSTHEVNFNYFMFQNLWLREKFRIP
ncbi:acetylxylan esterase [Mucilaginibacter flavidus]|uniref:acetylxylan esterase n=1 Tax=Mucilaginibacter flavidus TaxID=2949309 RepID=UPI002092563E|nr:acetylxylan esterase [Mucilaginibacter flavidus]MCO5950030.1 acetylxylan esterase [Mucilaginibacter flavidus]